MKQLGIAFTMFLLTVAMVPPAKAQEQEIQQLILNLQKLNQLRAILDQMYKGYRMISKGYNTVKDLSQGNFNLHKVFLDELMAVSPVVRQYGRVSEIIAGQRSLVKEYKTALRRFEGSDLFSGEDLAYIKGVYRNLFNRSAKNLDELLLVLTANQLRMNDAERLAEIDRIYAEMQEKLQFLRHFNNNTALLAAQKKERKKETARLQQLFGIGK